MLKYGHATLNHVTGMSTYLVWIPTIVSDRKSGQRGSPGLRQQTPLSAVHLSMPVRAVQLHSDLLHLLARVRRQRPSATRIAFLIIRRTAILAHAAPPYRLLSFVFMNHLINSNNKLEFILITMLSFQRDNSSYVICKEKKFK